jgi:hypothetical protein
MTTVEKIVIAKDTLEIFTMAVTLPLAVIRLCQIRKLLKPRNHHT